MDEELLISLVSQYKELYDTGDARYHDEERRNNIPQEIADLMKLRASEYRDRWKRLRDNFRRAKNLRKTKSGQAATKNKPIKYEKEMQFLTCYLETQEKCLTNISRQSSDDEEGVLDNMSPPSTPGSQCQMSSNSTASCSKKKKVQDEYGQSSTSAKTLFQSYIKKKYDQPRQEPDTVVDFFTNLGRTVKTFPEDIQIRVKGSIFKIINDAELEMYMYIFKCM
ncbi:uncharacterized protein LOC126735658 [Anthonomus grandis grandis]|uniref:uncharacterized protein LOC126735658 n=1 Tax=Anthonomus grandis grandis TaxID=2921223 RepID=UPI0021657C80|nr:uncharacterized protein LOC126735658 [Anthonomus grandis grandis]